MQRFKLVHLAVATLLASALIAGCSGGSKSSLPPTQSQAASGKTAGVTLTFVIPGASSTESARNPKYIPQGTESIVIKYQGDTAAAPPIPGGANPPSTAVTAATVNVTQTTTVPPPAGQCAVLGSGYECTVSIAIPVGVLDIYIIAYSGQNGTGTLLASGVTTAQVNANGSLTLPGTTTAAIVAPLTPNFGATGATFAFANATVGVTPGLVLPNPKATPTSIPAANFAAGQQTAGSPFSYSAAQGLTLKAADGTPVLPNTPISVTVKSNDISGNTCLVYEAQGASSATPCPFTSAGQTVTLTNSSDTYAVLYNNKFVPGAGFTISAALSGSSATATPQLVTITPQLVYSGSTFSSYGTGQIVWEPQTSAMYAGWSDSTHPLVTMPYTSASGYGTQSQIAVQKVNGVSSGSLQYGPNMMTLGADKNLWMTEDDRLCCGGITHYVAAYLLNSPETEPLGGTRLLPSAGSFVEYTLISSGPGPDGESRVSALGVSSGFVWVGDNHGDLWRIDPSTGTVYPNLGTPYTRSANANPAYPVTTTAGVVIHSNQHLGSNMISLGGKIYVSDRYNGLLYQLTPDTSANPSNKCVTGNPNACIATGAQVGSFLNFTPTLYTDGTNLYAEDGANLDQFTIPGLSHTTASLPFTESTYGGLAQGADGWFWTGGDSTAAFLPSMSASFNGQANLDAGGYCYTDGAFYDEGDGFALGPDNTLIMAISDYGSGYAAFCGVVY